MSVERINNNSESIVNSGAIRGLAILGIILHNYCHWLSGIVRENEYTFKSNNVQGMLHAFASPDSNFLLHIISFFGHYGVPLFLFLSAYGLEKKYASQPLSVPLAGFMGHHFRKLWGMMIVGFAAFTMIDLITPGSYHYTLGNVLGQITMTNNLFTNPDRAIWPGPYWFFGLMLQLYLIYRVAIFRRSSWVVVFLIVLCWLVQAVCLPTSDTLNQLRYNSIGGVLPFGLGILYARFEPKVSLSACYLLALGSLVGIFLGSLHYQTWFAVPALVCVFGLTFVRILPQVLQNGLAWVGSISAALFVSHPITRKIFIPISRQGDVYSGLVLYFLASIVVAIVFKRLIKLVSDELFKK